MFFCQLTAISVTALLIATVEAVSDNRELTRVSHQLISPQFKVITSDLIDISNPHEYADILLTKETLSLI